MAAASAAAFIAAGMLAAPPVILLGCMVVGRLLTALGESPFLTGLMSWGIARPGPPRTGKVMSWVGIAFYSALGPGAPAGLAIQDSHGFAGVGAVTLVMPLAPGWWRCAPRLCRRRAGSAWRSAACLA